MIEDIEINTIDKNENGGINKIICTHLGRPSYNSSILLYIAKLIVIPANTQSTIVNISISYFYSVNVINSFTIKKLSNGFF